MAKQLNVNMNFTADTSNVESNLNKLKQSLNQIASTPIKMGSVNEDLKQASVSARQLQVHLNNAFNTKTGNLDLGKFQNSLDKSGQSLTQLSKGLLGAGKDGQQAFLQMQSAIHNANIQIKKSTGFLAEMGTVLKNTIRWQLSSSMVHGFMSGVQQATGYVKDLNRSLTDIRIVTGQSTEDMAKFAEQANKSAKALSSTTTAYTNAALIYYQQGLDDKAVKERTDATIKMSNVTGQSAEEVSSYMTAIWNNFDDGSKSLEHYADVITALGASTASSSKEIAEGLEKFAAIGKTVGLSYDYATTALATVVAQTRQSADVVGTAFKTLFARIQDLELGKTLDDGTTLGKYSQALEAVGVNIKDSQGNLKNMNTILDEMGAKWQSLSKDQQVALAQNVAGVRQYTQLVALMNNWDKFQQNLGVAQNSDGALQEQADIYAESWEGASKRVKANLQSIYSQLIDDKVMIKGTNGIATMLDGVSKMIDAVGGLRTILLAVMAVVTKQMGPQIAETFDNLSNRMSYFGEAVKINHQNFKQFTAHPISSIKGHFSKKESDKLDVRGLVGTWQRTGELQQQKLLDDANKARQNVLEETKNSFDPQIKAFREEVKLQGTIFEKEKQLVQLGDKITASKREELKVEIDSLKAYNEKIVLAEKELAIAIDERNAKTEKNSERLYNKLGFVDNEFGGMYKSRASFNATTSERRALADVTGWVEGKNIKEDEQGKASLSIEVKTQEEGRKRVLEVAKQILKYDELINQAELEQRNLTQVEIEGETEILKSLGVQKETIAELTQARQELNRLISEGYNLESEEVLAQKAKIGTLEDQIEKTTSKKGVGVSTYERGTGQDIWGEAENDLDIDKKRKSKQLLQANYNKRKEEVDEKFDKATPGLKSAGQAMSDFAQGASQAAMGLSMVKGTWDTFQDEDASFFEKATSLVMGLSGGLQVLQGSFMALKTVIAINPIILGIMAIVAALAVLGVELYKIATAEKEAYENAKKEAQEAQDRVNAVNQSIQELQSSLNGLSGQKDHLYSLKKGSAEWNLELTKLNQQMLELKQSYAGLDNPKYIKTNADGLMELTEAGKEYLYTMQQAQLMATTAMSTEKQIAEKEAENTMIESKMNLSTEDLNVLVASYGTDRFEEVAKQFGLDLEKNGETIKSNIEAILANTASIEQLENTIRNPAYETDTEQILSESYKKDEADVVNETYDKYLEEKSVENTKTKFDLGKALTSVALGMFSGGISTIGNYSDYQTQTVTTHKYKTLSDQGINDASTKLGMNLEQDSKNLNKYTDKNTGQVYTAEEILNQLKEFALTNSTEFQNYVKEKADAATNAIEKNALESISNQETLMNDILKAEYTDDKKVDFSTYTSKDLDSISAIQEEQGLDNFKAAYDQYTKDKITEFNKLIDEKLTKIGELEFSSGTKEATDYIKNAQQAFTDYFNADGSLDGIELKFLASCEDPTGFLIFKDDGTIEINEQKVHAAMDKMTELEIKAQVKSKSEETAAETNLDTTELENYANHLREVSEDSKELSGKLQENAEAAVEVASSVMKMNRGIEKLSKNFSTWKDILENSTESSQEYSEAMNETKEALGDILGIEKDYVSTDFVKKHLNDIEKAAKGDAKAIDELGIAAAKDIAINVALENTGDQNIQSQVEKMVNDLDIPDIEVGATIDASTNAGFLEEMQGIVDAAQMTEEQANAFFESIGFTPEYKMEKETVTQQNPVIETVTTVPKITTTHIDDGSDSGKDIIGFSQTQTSRQVGTTESTAEIPIVSMNYNGGAKIKNLTRTAKGSMNNSSSSNKGGKSGSGGGGGGSKKTHNSAKQRYHTIDKQIGDNKRAYEALEKAKSKAYGIDKLKAMDAEIKKNDELIKQTRQRAAEVEKYRKEDKKALEDAANNFGIKVQYDKNGNIANYDAIMDQADKKAKSGDEEVEEKYTKLTEAINQYEETLAEAATTQDSLNELIEKTAQIELDKIEYKVDVKLELSERELKRLDYQIKQWERVNQNGFKDSTYVNNILGKMAENQNKYNTEENAIEEILKNRGANNKTIAKFLSGKLSNKELRALGLTDAELQSIKEHSDNMLGYAESISDAQDQIYSVFGENLEVYQSKYDEQINAIEHQKNVVSGLQEVFTLTGKGNAELLGQMRESVKEATLTSGLAAKQNMENVKTEIDRLQKFRDDAEKDGNDALVASLDSQLNTYQEYYDSQEEAYVSALQETIELIKDNLAASLEDFSKEYQKGIAGAYGTFGALELAMEMDEETRNMVVAPYQKAYELSKLTRDIQKSVDETDNIKAKQTLLKLEEKINAAREEGVELTQYDLDRMRAEYDLEIAKIALEEAQNAKNTVRMQRDNNGNWSYVYTADTDKIADAQQKYEEAVNAMRKLDDERLYSVQQQVVQIYKELDERIKDILTNDAYSDEEKKTMITQARETAKEQLTILGEEMQRVLDNQKDFYENEAENYHRFTNRNIEELGRWNTAFKDTLLGQANGYESGAEMVDSLEGSVNEYVNKAVEAFEKSKEAEKDVMEQLNVDATTANGAVNELNTTLQTTVKTIEDLGTALANADLAALTKINDASGKYQVTIDGADETFGAITLNLKKLAGFDTGGYTGEWNSTNGKLALLHQKELVLNEAQTRDLLETIKLLENYVLPTIKLAKFDNLNKKNATLDQNVMIQAEFPNVTNHLEIEEAFNNLINTASQYANRK